MELPLVRPRWYVPERVQSNTLAVEPKYDGRWLRVDNRNGVLRLTGHRESLVTGFHEPLMVDPAAYKRWGFTTYPPETVVEGELLPPEGTEATEVSSLLALRRYDALTFQPFTCLWLRGHSLARELYVDGREQVFSFLPLPPLITYYGVSALKPTIERLRALHHDSTRRHLEGFVLKGYWYNDWWKWKPTREVDAMLTHVNLGTAGQWKGLCKSVAVSLYDERGELTEIANVSGMTQALHQSICDDDLGRVVVVEYDSLAAQGRLKFPRFLRFHSDKDPKACTLESLK